MNGLERFRKQHTVLLTTFRRDGTPVGTPVSLAVDDDPARGYIRTWSKAGKAKRIRNNARVTVAPSTFRGKVLGPATEATAELVGGDEEQRARQLLRRKHPFMHGLFVPVIHRIARYRTQHYLITPDDSGDESGSDVTGG